MNRIIQLPAQLTSYQDKVDRSASLRFVTRELSDEEITILRGYRGSEGYLVFKENQIQPDEIPKDDAPTEGKTHSERLRAVMFLLWKQNGSKGDFESYRRAQIEKLISLYKDKLED